MVLPKFGVCRNSSGQAGDSAVGFKDCSRGRFTVVVNGRRTQSISRHDRILAAVRRALQHNSLASHGYPSQQSLCFQTFAAIREPVAGATGASALVPQVSPYFLSYFSVPSMGQTVCVAHRCQCGQRGRGVNTGLRGGRAGRHIRQPSVVSNGRSTRRYTKRVYGSIVGSSPLPPLFGW